MTAATANLVIESVWAFLAVLLATFITAIIRLSPELAAATPAAHAAPPVPATVAARSNRTHYVGRHARGRAGRVSAGPPWGPAPEPPAFPR